MARKDSTPASEALATSASIEINKTEFNFGSQRFIVIGKGSQPKTWKARLKNQNYAFFGNRRAVIVKEYDEALILKHIHEAKTDKAARDVSSTHGRRAQNRDHDARNKRTLFGGSSGRGDRWTRLGTYA